MRGISISISISNRISTAITNKVTAVSENTRLKNFRTQTEHKTLNEHKGKVAKKNAKIKEPVGPAIVFRDLSQLCSFTTRVLWAVTREQQQKRQ